jgi:two-component system phosphate regulon sensor histidine kinase PhoR
VTRRLFFRLLGQNCLTLLVLLVGAGFALDRYLVDRELDALTDRLAWTARLVAAVLPQDPPGMQAFVRQHSRTAGVRLTVIARDGTVLADSHQDPATMENHGNRPEILTAYAGQRGRSLRLSTTLGMEMLYVAPPGQPVVRAAMPQTDVTPLLAGIRRRILLAAIPALCLAFALVLFLSRTFTRRFGAMSLFASRLADGDYASPLAVRGHDELADLEGSLMALRDNLANQVGALKHDRKRLTLLTDGLPDAVVLLDGERRIIRTNEPARRLLRISGKTEGLSGPEVLREPKVLEALDCMLVDRPTAGPPLPFRVTWPEPACELEVRLSPIPDEQGRPGVLVLLRDMTRQAELERVRTDFIANLSHELRTPLTAIRGAAETLLDAAAEDPAASQRFLETIRRHSLRLEALLADVSDLARIESGGYPVEPRPFDARSVARETVELFATEADRAEVSLEVGVPAEELTITSDPGVVESILVNLLQNAVRYTPKGGRVTLRLLPAQEGVRYVVEDTGIGIPPKDIPRVTERFYRADPGRSRAQGGTGLGLSIVKHLVEGLGGTLEIESEYGKWTRVTVFVPDRAGAASSPAG